LTGEERKRERSDLLFRPFFFGKEEKPKTQGEPSGRGNPTRRYLLQKHLSYVNVEVLTII
jgi:hypothetical protein